MKNDNQGLKSFIIIFVIAAALWVLFGVATAKADYCQGFMAHTTCKDGVLKWGCCGDKDMSLLAGCNIFCGNCTCRKSHTYGQCDLWCKGIKEIEDGGCALQGDPSVCYDFNAKQYENCLDSYCKNIPN